jgi:hypothetical protein
MINELVIILKEGDVPDRVNVMKFARRVREKPGKTCQDRWYPDTNSNQEPPEHMSTTLSLDQPVRWKYI